MRLVELLTSLGNVGLQVLSVTREVPCAVIAGFLVRSSVMKVLVTLVKALGSVLDTCCLSLIVRVGRVVWQWLKSVA